MQGKEIRTALYSGKLIYGTHVTNLSNLSAAAVCMTAGFDYVFICGEHMPLDSKDIANLCQFYRNNGVAPIVRISNPDPVEAGRALDLGAQGIVVPYIEEVKDVKALVGAVHYRPLKGAQLKRVLDGEPVSEKYKAFFDRFNADNFLIIGIESQTAYNRFDELTAVPGVNGVFLGPHDITVSVGHPEDWGHSAYMELIKNTIVRCRAKNIGVGAHMPPSLFSREKAQELINLGMNWILDGSDVGWAAKAMGERRLAFGLGPVQKSAAGSPVVTCAAVEIKK